MPSLEHAPLDRTYIHSFDQGDSAFPILGIAKDPRAGGYSVPTDLAAHPDTTTWPNHKFYSVTPTADDRRVLWLYGIFPGAQTITYDIDDECQQVVTITKQRIEKPANAAAITALNSTGTLVVYVPENDVVGMKVTSVIGTAPTGRTETAWREFHFPALVVAPAVSASHEALDGTVRVVIDWQHRSARRLPALHQNVITYGSEASLTIPALEWDPQLQDLDRNGLFLNPPRMIGVLCNTIALDFNTSSDNPKWGYIAESLDFAESSPTVTSYLADYLGNYKIVAAAKAPWKYNLWRMVVTKVKMR